MKQIAYRYTVPEQKRVRVLIVTDAKNEADDQYAIAHFLMTPKVDVRGIIPAHFDKCHVSGSSDRISVKKVRNLLGFMGHGDALRTGAEEISPQELEALKEKLGLEGVLPLWTAEESLKEVRKILRLMELEGVCPVEKGAEGPLPDEETPVDSAGARLIIAEAMRDDPRPLYIACLSAITDLASAILLEPKICQRATCIWIGGGAYPDGEREFNISGDFAASNAVLCSSMPLWQIPMNVYKQMAVSLAELQYKVAPCGEIGKYLFEQMVEVNDRLAIVPHWPHGEIWGLGDSPSLGVLLFEQERTDVYDVRPAPRVDPETCRYIHDQPNREIRVYKDANVRLTLEDFFCKLAINYKD